MSEWIFGMRLIGSLILHFRCVAPTHPTHPFHVQLLSEVMSVVMVTKSTAHSYSDLNFLVFPALYMPGNKSLKRMRSDCYPRVLITPRKHCARELEEAGTEKNPPKNNNNLPGKSKGLLISLAIRLLSSSDKHRAGLSQACWQWCLENLKISNVNDKQLTTRGCKPIFPFTQASVSHISILLLAHLHLKASFGFAASFHSRELQNISLYVGQARRRETI